jgi:hypothetical protein
MKIYINNLNLDILNEIAEIIKDKLLNTETYIELFTDEGIYHIEDKNIYILDTNDNIIKKYENYYNNFTIIVDTSYFNKKQISSIHGEKHLSFKTKKNYYKLNGNSNVYLIIKYYYDKSKLIPNDIYFELDREIDINDIFIKKEIIEFLSILN